MDALGPRHQAAIGRIIGEVARSWTSAAEQSDAALAAALASGDREALAALYDRHAAYLLGVATRVLESRRDAEDLLHDVFLEAWRRIESFDPERGTLRAWLAARVRSRAIDRHRQRARARAHGLELQRGAEQPPATGTADDPAREGDRLRARRALATLSEVQRTAIELLYFEGLSAAEAAERCGVPHGTVKSRLAAGIATLRKELGADGSLAEADD